MSKANSPIYGGFANPPATLPLGVPIADRVTISEIDLRTATRVYESHHSYLPRARHIGWHYGVYLDDGLVGAITFGPWPSEGEIRGYESSEIVEVGRVCIAHDTPNLASCAMSKAQDKFLRERPDCDGEESALELLVTYIREDYHGSMFRALRGKGWEYDSDSKGQPPGNRESREIHDYDKERWVCEL